MSAAVAAIFFAAALALGPHAYVRNIVLGFDFMVYVYAGLGNLRPYGPEAFPRYVYSPKTAIIWRPLSSLPLPVAFGAFYVASAASLAALLYLTIGELPRSVWANLGLLVAFLWGAVNALRNTNVVSILALAVVHPIGAIAASCLKPQLLLFVALHLVVGNICICSFLAAAVLVPLLFLPDRRAIRENIDPTAYIMVKHNLIYLASAWVVWR